MKRTYHVGDQKDTVEVVEDVVVAMPDLSAAWKLTEDKTAVKSLPESERTSFEAIGCRFVRSKKVDIHPSSMGRVCRHDDGSVAIGTHRLTVKFRPAAKKAEVLALLKKLGVQVVAQLTFAKHMFDVRAPEDADPFQVAETLRRKRICEFAIPELIERIQQREPPGSSSSAGDPKSHLQWQWPKIDGEGAWKRTRGKGIRVAVIDFGFDLAHPDLSTAVVRAGCFKENGLHGPATFIAGKSFVPVDKHGTFCAGMAVARAENGIAGLGIAPEADLVAVSCLQNGIGTQQSLARAIAYAADPTREDPVNSRREDGAHVISCSIFPPRPDRLHPVLDLAIRFATTRGRSGKGTPFFYAVSNSAQPVAKDAFASHPSVIAVGNSSRADTAFNSARGPELDFIAPGKGVYSTLPRGRFGKRTGTSFATPCAAGVAALVLVGNHDLTWRQVRDRLRSTCDKVSVNYGSDGHHARYGFGRINAARAVAGN